MLNRGIRGDPYTLDVYLLAIPSATYGRYGPEAMGETWEAMMVAGLASACGGYVARIPLGDIVSEVGAAMEEMSPLGVLDRTEAGPLVISIMTLGAELFCPDVQPDLEAETVRDAVGLWAGSEEGGRSG